MYAQPQEPIVPSGLSCFGEWFSETFQVFSARWKVWVLQGLVLFLFNGLPGLVILAMMIPFFIASISQGGAGVASNDAMNGLSALSNIVNLVTSVFTMLLYPGMLKTAIKQLRGEEIAVGDIFSGMRHFWGFFLIGLCVLLGLCGCGIGAIIVGVLLTLALPIMVDQDVPVTQALSMSWNVCKRNFWLFLLYGFVLSLLVQAGTIACGVGVIATTAFGPIGIAVAYMRIFYPYGYSAAPPMTPMVPTYMPPPYAGPGAPPPTVGTGDGA